MSQLDFDVLIIGAGPAGSTAAAFARQRGLRVLIVEKDHFPRFHVGESLLPRGNARLRESGAWPKIEAAGFFKKRGAYFFLAEGPAEKEVVFAEGLIPGMDYTYQVERAKFDALLLDHAEALGAVVLQLSTVRAVSPRPGGCSARITTPSGERDVTAAWILDGGGRENLFSCDLKRDFDPPCLQRRVAIYSHFTGVGRAQGPAAGHTVVVRLPDGWFWLIPLDENKTSVGLVTTTDALRERRAEAPKLFADVVASSSRLRGLMAEATSCEPFRITTDYSYFRRRLASDRTLLIGDAAGFFDPIFSSGVYVALESAQRAVDLVARAHAGGRALTKREGRRYTRDLKRHARVFEKLIRVFYDNHAFAVFMSPRPPLRIGQALNAIVAGNAHLTWKLWWRFHLFLLVCRLQKYFRLSEPISFAGMNGFENSGKQADFPDPNPVSH